MSEIKNEFVCSVKKENNLGYYRLHTVWKDDGFSINIATKDASWRGEMTPENIKQTCKRLQQDSETYLKDCKDILTVNDGKPGIKYMVEDGSFVWKKLVDEDAGIHVKMGAVPVQPSSFVETIQKIVDVSLNTNKHLQKEIKTLTEEKDKLGENNTKLFLALDEAKKRKTKMENDLYEKFIELLNSKKKMILDLQNKLENKQGVKNVEIKAKSTKVNKPPPTKKKRMTAKKALSDMDAYEVETENDSDEEEMPATSQRKSPRLSAKNSQSNNSPQNSQELSTRKKTSPRQENSAKQKASPAAVVSEPKNKKCDVEIEIDSDSTISDEDLYILAKSASNEEVIEGKKKNEVIAEKIQETSPQKTKQISNSIVQNSEDLLKSIWG